MQFQYIKSSLFLAILFIAKFGIKAQGLYFPPLNGNNWDTISPTSLGWCTSKIAPLYNYLNQKNTKAFIVLKDGKIALEKYFGTFTADSAWYWASAGKSLTAMLVGIAQQDGKLSIQDTSGKYLGKGWTNCLQAQEDKIRIRHQLSMSSGLDDGVSDHYCTLDTCLVYKADAGTRWAYHNGPYTLLDGVIENATGQTMNAFFNQKVKTLTGINGLFIKSGYNNVFYSKPRMAARFGLLMLSKGSWDIVRVLKDTAFFRQMTNTSQTMNKSYGYLWWLNGKQSYMAPGFQVVIPGPLFPNAPSDMFSALGKNGQFINVVPSQNLVMIRMGNEPGGGDVPFLLNDSIWKKLNEVMCLYSNLNLENSKPNFRIFPNPSSGKVQVTSNGVPFDMRIYNIAGKIVSSNTQCEDGFVISDLSPGLYYLHLRGPNGLGKVEKLIIEKSQ